VSEPLHVEVSALASGQIREAEAWWRVNRTKAPNAIREELERASVLVAAQPHIGARARNLTLLGVRRLHLARIRYDIYYRVTDAPRQLEILAFWHTRRGTTPPI
jgi:plasmid stabilization system protein ParE